MIKSVEELKELTTWLKDHKVTQFKVGDIEVHFAPQAFFPTSLADLPFEPKKSEEELKKEEEAILFHSAG